MKQSTLPLMVQNYAKMFGVTVRIQGSTAYTNGKTITIPRLDANKPNVTRLALAYLAHESAHIRYTDFGILKKERIKNDLFLFSLFNVLEDSRIETLISKEYIGVYENLLLLNNYFTDEWEAFKKGLKSIPLLNVVLAYIQLLAQGNFQKYKNKLEDSEVLYEDLIKRISPATVDNIKLLVEQSVTAFDSENIYKSCLKIENLLMDYMNESNKQNSYNYEQNFRNIFEESKKAFNKAKKKVSAEYLSEFTKFRLACGDDDSKVTPNRNPAEIIQLQSNSKSSSSREDLGALVDNRANRGSDDFIKEVSISYGLRNALRQKVLAYVDFYNGFSEVGRRIDPLKAQRVCVGESNIFKMVDQKRDYSTDIAICVDVSSSMLTSAGLTSAGGEEMSRCGSANRVALSLALALENIEGIDTSVTYFPGSSSEYEIALKFGEKASVMAPYFDQKPRGSTPLAQCLWKVFSTFEDRESNRKIVIVITDGMPDSVSNTNKCFEYAKEQGIDIYGISICSEMILKLFDKAVIVNSHEELYKKSFYTVNKLFEINKFDRRMLEDVA